VAGTKALSHKDMDGLKVINLAAGVDGTDGANVLQVATAETNAKSRANHTGTQLASTVSDFDTQVRTSRLDQMSAPTGSVSLNSQRATNVSAATTDTDAAQWGQVKDLISGRRKADVRIATTTDDSLTGLGARDDITPTAGDRVLVTGQTGGTTNGIYEAAAGAWTRAPDADAPAEFATAWLVSVKEGTANADTVWQHTTDAAVTLGTTALTFAKLGPLTTTTGGYTTTCPAVSAGATWTVTHNLNTRKLIVQVARVASPYDFLDARVERPTANTVAVLPDKALSSGEFEIMVYKVA
jgi:hypothetical protein